MSHRRWDRRLYSPRVGAHCCGRGGHHDPTHGRRRSCWPGRRCLFLVVGRSGQRWREHHDPELLLAGDGRHVRRLFVNRVPTAGHLPDLRRCRGIRRAPGRHDHDAGGRNRHVQRPLFSVTVRALLLRTESPGADPVAASEPRLQSGAGPQSLERAVLLLPVRAVGSPARGGALTELVARTAAPASDHISRIQDARASCGPGCGCLEPWSRAHGLAGLARFFTTPLLSISLAMVRPTSLMERVRMTSLVRSYE
jgi:hypothetical protein